MFVACGQRIVYTNTAFLKLLGEDNRDNIIGANPSSFLDEESRSRFQDAINATELRGGRENLSGVRVQRVDQTTVDVEIGMTIVVYDHETGVQVFVNDVTEQRKAAQALADSEARYRIIAEFTSDFVYWRASDGKLLYVSPSALDFCGYAPAELERRPNLLTEMVHPDDRDLWMRHMLEEKMSQSPRPVEFRILTREGVVRWVTHVCRPVMGADGGYQGVRASDRDITRRRIMEEELRRLTNQDGLTGISNRRYFDEEYDKEWRRALRAKAPLSVVLMDVDHFKAYNDTYGHQMGDECLRNVAGVLQSGVKRPGDVVARYGGEEFVLILPNTPLLAAREIAEQMRRTIAALEIEHSKSPVASVVSISAGIAGGVPAAGMDSRLFIEQADKALYEAKHSGRNRVALAGALSAGSLG
jgi:diguanylate cyclase (GGDEF)-like protein/PAS domain S-box-containing protein